MMYSDYYNENLKIHLLPVMRKYFPDCNAFFSRTLRHATFRVRCAYVFEEDRFDVLKLAGSSKYLNLIRNIRAPEKELFDNDRAK